MSGHDAWLVDLDGTLYSSSPVRVAMLAELSLSGWELLGTLRRFRSEHEVLRRTQAEPVPSPYQLQLERTAGALGVAPALVEASVREWMLERPAKWLKRFRRSALIAELTAYRARGGRRGGGERLSRSRQAASAGAASSCSRS